MFPCFTFVVRRSRSFLWVALFTMSSLCGQEVEWTRQFGTPGEDVLWAISVDAADIYVAGSTAGKLPGQVHSGLQDAFLRKYGANPNDFWTRQFGTDQADSANAMLTDAAGVYVAGHVRGEIFLRKYAPDGSELRTWPFGTLGQAMAVSAAAPGVYVAGWTSGTLPDQTSAGGLDAFVRKYDPEGNALWTRQFGTAMRDYAKAVASDATGVYVAGWTRGTLPGQANAGGTVDAFVRKYDPEGNELWTQQFGSGNDDVALGLSVDATGVYVVGETVGALAGQANLGSTDLFVRKYTRSGEEVWTRQFGTDREDHAIAASVDASGLYVGGWTWGAFPGQRNIGKTDAFVAKLGLAGSPGWILQFGTPEADTLNGMDVDSSCVYVCGATEGIFAGTANAGLADAYLLAICGSSPQILGIDLFSDANGNLLHDPGEETATTSPGGEVRFLADFINTAEVALTVTATLEGLPAGWAEMPEPLRAALGREPAGRDRGACAGERWRGREPCPDLACGDGARRRHGIGAT